MWRLRWISEERIDVVRICGVCEGLVSVIGHADRAKPLRDYCVGLMLPCERKSVEPMAAATAPSRVAAQHQSLLHFVGEGQWSDEKVLAKVREMVLPEMERHRVDRGLDHRRHRLSQAGAALGWRGAAILRPARQTEQLSRCVAVIANHHASLPVAYRLYLPQDWAKDRQRRRQRSGRSSRTSRSRPSRRSRSSSCTGLCGRPSSRRGADGRGLWLRRILRAGVSALALSYVTGILPQTCMGIGHRAAAEKWSGRGRPPKLIRRDGKHQPTSVDQLALGLPKIHWRTVKWRVRPSSCPRRSTTCAFVWRIAITISPKAEPDSGC